MEKTGSFRNGGFFGFGRLPKPVRSVIEGLAMGAVASTVPGAADAHEEEQYLQDIVAYSSYCEGLEGGAGYTPSSEELQQVTDFVNFAHQDEQNPGGRTEFLSFIPAMQALFHIPQDQDSYNIRIQNSQGEVIGNYRISQNRLVLEGFNAQTTPEECAEDFANRYTRFADDAEHAFAVSLAMEIVGNSEFESCAVPSMEEGQEVDATVRTFDPRDLNSLLVRLSYRVAQQPDSAEIPAGTNDSVTEPEYAGPSSGQQDRDAASGHNLPVEDCNATNGCAVLSDQFRLTPPPEQLTLPDSLEHHIGGIREDQSPEQEERLEPQPQESSVPEQPEYDSQNQALRGDRPTLEIRCDEEGATIRIPAYRDIAQQVYDRADLQRQPESERPDAQPGTQPEARSEASSGMRADPLSGRELDESTSRESIERSPYILRFTFSYAGHNTEHWQHGGSFDMSVLYRPERGEEGERRRSRIAIGGRLHLGVVGNHVYEPLPGDPDSDDPGATESNAGLDLRQVASVITAGPALDVSLGRRTDLSMSVGGGVLIQAGYRTIFEALETDVIEYPSTDERIVRGLIDIYVGLSIMFNENSGLDLGGQVGILPREDAEPLLTLGGGAGFDLYF